MTVISTTNRPHSRLRILFALVCLCFSLVPARATKLLIPMDGSQQNHLKAYGLAFQAIKSSQRAEWLLNYRGGSFLLPDAADLRRRLGALAGAAGHGAAPGAMPATSTAQHGGRLRGTPGLLKLILGWLHTDCAA